MSPRSGGWGAAFKMNVGAPEDMPEVTSPFQKIVLWSPVAFFPFVLAELYFQFELPSVEKMTRYFVQNILFLNTVHVAITFYFLARYDGFRRALRASICRRPVRFYIVLGVMLALGPACYLLPKLIPGGWEWASLGVLILALFATNHGVWQTRGIGLSYGTERSEMSLRRDKWGFVVFLVTAFAVRIWGVGAGSSRFPVLSAVFISAGIFVGLWLLAINIAERSFYRGIFYFRLVYIALIPVSQVAVWIGPCFHGLEYLDFFRRMNKDHDPIATSRSRTVFGVLAFAVPTVLAILPFVGMMKGDFKEPESIFLQSVIGLNFGITFVHYYLDEKIFAFSIPETREALRPFFEKPPISRSY